LNVVAFILAIVAGAVGLVEAVRWKSLVAAGLAVLAAAVILAFCWHTTHTVVFN